MVQPLFAPWILTASIAVLGGALLAEGQDAGGSTAPNPIVADRPSVTLSSVVVPRGSLQAENGFLESQAQGQSTWDAPETLLRFGVASKTELRLTAPDYFGNVPTAAGSSSGFGDLAIGIKQQLGPALGGFDVSLVISLSLPTGASTISSHGYDPSVQLPWSRALSPHWTAAGMLSVYWPTQVGGRNATGEPTFLLDRQLTKPWDVFVEYAGDFSERGGPRQLAHFGTTYKLGHRLQQQVDFHVGVGLSSAAKHYFIGAGYSFRFQAIRR